jgi:proteic killer suppression protein
LIASFKDPATETLFHGGEGKALRRIPPDIRSVAARKLDMINAAHQLGDLRAPPGNRLEALKGDLEGKHASGSTTDGASSSDGRRHTHLT